MDKIAPRPKEDTGEPLRDKRVPVMMTSDERQELKRAALEMGVGVSTYLRLKALEAARAGRNKRSRNDQ